MKIQNGMALYSLLYYVFWTQHVSVSVVIVPLFRYLQSLFVSPLLEADNPVRQYNSCTKGGKHLPRTRGFSWSFQGIF